jgi:hypothetical protein
VSVFVILPGIQYRITMAGGNVITGEEEALLIGSTAIVLVARQCELTCGSVGGISVWHACAAPIAAEAGAKASRSSPPA